jgi:3-oxoacyl-[acyl-carrier-protein] synthase-3
MAGILSIGWYLPARRASVDQVAAEYGVSAQALHAFGLRSKVVAEPDDHPTTLAARATAAALAAADLTPSQLDLLIFTGATRDRPAPWIAAFGVLHELGASSAAGFDLHGRCPGLADALWIASTLIQAGSVATVAVCTGDRFDHLFPALPGESSIAQAVHTAGGAAAILGARTGNEIVARAHATREDLSGHAASSPAAGGSRWPLDRRALDERAHTIQDAPTVAQIAELRDYFRRAEQANIEAVCRTAGFDGVDFITGSVLNAKDQGESLAALGIGPDKYLMMTPRYGYVGASSALISIGNAIQEGRPVGPRLVMNLRTYVYCNAIAIRGAAPDLGIRVSGPMYSEP